MRPSGTWGGGRSSHVQTLSLSAMKTNLSRSSLQDVTVNSLKKAQRSQPPKFSQATDEKPIFEASEKDRGQLQEEIMGGLKESPEPSKQEVARWTRESRKRRRREKGWSSRTQGCGRSRGRNFSKLISKAENLLTTFPFSDLLRERGSQAKEKMAMAPSTGQ